MTVNKKMVLGQFFTKKNMVVRLLDLLFSYKPYSKGIRILEPAYGTGNFIQALKDRGFTTIVGCEIDQELTDTVSDFFDLSLDEKFDLIIGNPPFTKYNLRASYYRPELYNYYRVKKEDYLPKEFKTKSLIRMESAFILKSIKHLKDKESSIAYVLPISFFIGNKNSLVKKILIDNFSTIIIFQNDENWFNYLVPCAFAVFTNISGLREKIVLIYESNRDKTVSTEILDKSEFLTAELIPKSFFFIKNLNLKGVKLSLFLSGETIKYAKSYRNNNVSAANIDRKTLIPAGENVSDYHLAVARVGNSSVGRAGLINIKHDILNDMFYVFKFKKEFDEDKIVKESICEAVNSCIGYFRNITVRVGSKSLKKKDILELRVNVKK